MAFNPRSWFRKEGPHYDHPVHNADTLDEGHVQFARLLALISERFIGKKQLTVIAKETGLTVSQLHRIFAMAQEDWAEILERTGDYYEGTSSYRAAIFGDEEFISQAQSIEEFNQRLAQTSPASPNGFLAESRLELSDSTATIALSRNSGSGDGLVATAMVKDGDPFLCINTVHQVQTRPFIECYESDNLGYVVVHGRLVDTSVVEGSLVSTFEIGVANDEAPVTF